MSEAELIQSAHAAKFQPETDEKSRNDPPWGIEDNTFPFLKKLIEGKRITEICREPSSDESFPQDANGVVITLEDGSRLHFDGWGYDACGLNLSFSPPV